jgi:hypothetical protein
MRRLAFAIAVFALLPACEPMPTETKQVISDWRSGKPDADCEIPGESGQWMADYCLAAVQTDDLVAAQPCLEHERNRRHGEECATRREYKQDWCRLVVRSGAREGSFAQCIADPHAAGAIVKGSQTQ